MTYPRRIVALDLETSDKNKAYGYIKQIACVVMEDGEVIGDPFYKTVEVPKSARIALEAVEAQIGSLQDKAKVAEWLTGFLSGDSASDVFDELLAWSALHRASDYPNVAQNLHFDLSFVTDRLLFPYKLRGNPFSPVWIDTLELARQMMPGKRSYALGHLCSMLGLPEQDKAHDALQDAILAGRVYHRLTTDAQVTA